jgi:hypothetical protein
MAYQDTAELDRAAAHASKLTASSTWTDKVQYLQQLFGQRLTAVIADVDDTRAVGRWIQGAELPAVAQNRLRDAYHVIKLIELAESRETAQSWFLGMNPNLNDQSPAQLIVDDVASGGEHVLRAARTFLSL